MITVFKGRRMVIIRIEIKNIMRKEKKARNINKSECYHYTEPGEWNPVCFLYFCVQLFKKD